MATPTTNACPCGTGKPYAACCEPLLAQKRQAATAEELMRSRFTAHFRKDFAHVHRTFAETASEPYVPDPEQKGMAWTRLVVHSHEPGANADAAFVDFTAYYQEGDKEQALHEKAAFKRIDGVWLYTGPVRQGPAPIKAASTAGRNDPCPCGSGKKYKKCCGR